MITYGELTSPMNSSKVICGRQPNKNMFPIVLFKLVRVFNYHFEITICKLILLVVIVLYVTCESHKDLGPAQGFKPYIRIPHDTQPKLK